MPYSVTAREDPDRKAYKIRNQWAVSSPAQLGIRVLNGQVRPATSLIFCEGDFVDVAFTMEIVELRNKTVVNLVLEHVVRLIARPMDIAEVTGTVDDDEPPTIHRVLESTIRFE
ncbi:hypothetical protein CALCODRAFT_479589 [Calocera cornea HHB12733]|uniref:Uncharacterized protein n=1 Tax=Calocera cornea HHB12733 TaxID=1353952 RepID=A0A165JGR6_9BASI|nr:hypothetical protein CALCODRAFT_479589 [Calocera cornea HHB12733]